MLKLSNSYRPFCYTAALLLLAVFTKQVTAGEDDSSFGYKTLSGLKSVSVRVEGMRRNFKNLGQVGTGIQAFTEEKLTLSGLQIVDIDIARIEPGAAFLRVNVTTNENQYGFYYYGVSVELKRKISLNNPAGGFITGTIWKKGSTGVVMPTELVKIRVAIDGLLTQFLADYRSKNPSR